MAPASLVAVKTDNLAAGRLETVGTAVMEAKVMAAGTEAKAAETAAMGKVQKASNAIASGTLLDRT